eukprot:100353_1
MKFTLFCSPSFWKRKQSSFPIMWGKTNFHEKVKVQASPAGTWPDPLVPATAEMFKQRANTRLPFGSLVLMWTRQIPYTIVKFFFFEQIVEGFYTYVYTKPKSSYGKGTQLGVTFMSGYLAGIICAIVSHPADTMVSLLGKESNKGKGKLAIAREFGWKNLMVKGLPVRILMIGTLTGFQWWIYDTYKSAMGMGTTGGGVAKK